MIEQNIWHPFTPLAEGYDPLEIVKANGMYIYTKDERKILDAVSSWWVNIHGHANKKIADAISEQAHSLEHVIFAGFTHQPAEELAKSLIELLPSMNKVFFSDDGSTAIEVALKICLQHFHNKNKDKTRTKIIAIEGAYHGDTFGAMAVCDRTPFNASFNSLLFDVEFIPRPTEENWMEVKEKFIQIVKTGEVAAFIFEPIIQGAGGMQTYSPKHLDELIKLAHNKNTFCIADEIMTGFGRTDHLFASEYLQEKPDLICLSKGITGGFLPLAVTLCTKEVAQPFYDNDILKTFFHGHSYTGNPIACAAANASLEILLSDECFQNRKRIAEKHNNFAKQINSNNKLKDKILEVRTCGTIFALELRTEEQTSYFNEWRKNIYNYFLDKNILLRPLGNVIYMIPPYIITDEELDLVYNEILNFLEK
ncbi:adenosylmethionine-8-amino-7-oxononanoate transaminase [Bernardetia litoralis DSM 6794]|uniref:Adenosylmethionine-8-amino-7-oxononanoate aminotransferase n=1 Tax=Bernardetia litoralis (strain ATCC 23117 / DSM 6794 / NBRC 15988 / NCIMB 1366 / Fx l1 / Sio-4) TaxID=880071 RepID=I4AHG9_BERLS|nr:adenosylmethionine--8-amino-7-oxononanoate transaminase [Bernardetia litoralis]AFM03404.1 adenosylmethionine-8-amino-7-oxononanoate transaminase [Bernardetia litoralis DSM 6794]